MKIKYFFCFKEDKRSSMDMLANFISIGQKKFKKNLIYNIIPKPFLPKFLISLNFFMRFERYVTYPIKSFLTVRTDIAHVIDHSYSHLVNFLNAKKKIVTINDLIPIIFQKKLNKKFLLFKYSISKIKNFDHIIALSNQSKKDLIKYTKINKNKITVIYPHIENIFNESRINKKKISLNYKLPINKKKIIVFDTSFYKNYKYSFKLFLELQKKNKNIILIKIGNHSEINNRDNILNSVYNFNFLSRHQMSEIYKISDLLLFPSLYEGFGIPCMEAMKTGLPVVASNKGSLKEILSSKSVFNLSKKKIIIKHILKLFSDKKYLEKHKKISKKHSSNFQNLSYRHQVREVYKKVLKIN